MAPDLFFPDVSNFQPNVDFGALRGQASVVAVQVSWGTQVTIPTGRIAAVRAARFDAVLWYLGITTANSAAQVAAFVNTLGPLEAGESVWIDWESTGDQSPPPAAQRDEIAGLVAAHYGIPVEEVGVYGPNSLLAESPPKGPVWTASYETSEPATPHTIWQFTNGTYVSNPFGPINFAGVGFCDASVFHGTAAELLAILCPSSHPANEPDQGSVYMIPSNCTDDGSVRAQIRDWWSSRRSDPMGEATRDVLVVFYHLPANQVAWGKNGFGGDPDLLLAWIMDDASTKGTLRPNFAGAV